LFSFLIKL